MITCELTVDSGLITFPDSGVTSSTSVSVSGWASEHAVPNNMINPIVIRHVEKGFNFKVRDRIIPSPYPMLSMFFRMYRLRILLPKFHIKQPIAQRQVSQQPICHPSRLFL